MCTKIKQISFSLMKKKNAISSFIIHLKKKMLYGISGINVSMTTTITKIFFNKS